MAPYQERVIEERKELDERLFKLANFLATETFKKLDPAERERLLAQYVFMMGYADVLARRVAAFGN